MTKNICGKARATLEMKLTRAFLVYEKKPWRTKAFETAFFACVKSSTGPSTQQQIAYSNSVWRAEIPFEAI